MKQNSRDKNYIRRNLEGKIRKFLDTREIIAIFGARQVGKTTLIRHIFDGLPGPKAFLDFEDPELVNLFDEDIKAFARLYLEGQKYVFIDEFQYSQLGGKNLKFIYDHFQTKFLITGSSSLDLAVRTASALVGRIFIFELYPLSFYEFLSYKMPPLLSMIRERITADKPLPTDLHNQLIKLVREFTIWGGYPRAVTARDSEEKTQVLKNIFITYLLKDIKGFFRLATESSLQKLLRALALQTGGLIRYEKLSQVSGLNLTALKEHLSILEETYVLSLSRPFFTNKRLEIVKNPRVYFQDMGLRNYLCQDFRDWEFRTDAGMLAENFVASELLKKGFHLNFWRTKSGGEVDFVIQNGGIAIPLEVKSGQVRVVGKSLRSFLKKYHPPRAYILHAGTFFTLKTEGIPFIFMPFYGFSTIEFGEAMG